MVLQNKDMSGKQRVIQVAAYTHYGTMWDNFDTLKKKRITNEFTCKVCLNFHSAGMHLLDTFIQVSAV